MTITIDKRAFQDLIPPEGNLTQNNTLSLFQKILLITDGTVTDLISLYAGEPIRVRIIKQEIVQNKDLNIFVCPPETRILNRHVLLGSEIKNYVYAESYFVMDLLPPSIQDALMGTDKPIGLMWKDEKLETYREILGYKIEQSESMTLYFNGASRNRMLSRTYIIYNKQNVLGIITEKFPSSYFKRVA